MPGMNGRELADQFAERFPDVRVLFSSGYTSDVVVHRGVVDAEIPFVSKPYSQIDLARKVRDLLERQSV